MNAKITFPFIPYGASGFVLDLARFPSGVINARGVLLTRGRESTTYHRLVVGASGQDFCYGRSLQAEICACLAWPPRPQPVFFLFSDASCLVCAPSSPPSFAAFLLSSAFSLPLLSPHNL